MHIDNLFELQQTAKFYGYHVYVYPEIKGGQEHRISLIEVGSEIEIASWSGINTLERAINWCTWLFEEQQQNEDRINRS